MTAKQKIAVDLDDTLAATIEGTLAHASEVLGRELAHGDISTIEYWEQYGISDSEAIGIVHAYNLAGFPGLKPIPGARQAVARLAQWYDLYVVTARDQELEAVTKKWLERYFPGLFSGVIITGNPYLSKKIISKAEICMSLDASWIIDDSKQHIITCTDKGLRGILFGGHAWQAGVQSTPLLYTARDWEEVSDVILGVSDVYASNSTRQTAVVADSFRDRVEELVSLIPKGRVMTYGQLAVLSGSPRAARIVGGIAHYGNPDLPWHRVVNRHGGTAVGFPGGRLSQQKLLQAEGIVFDEHDHLNIMEYQWRPL